MVDSGATARETWIETDGARLVVHDVDRLRALRIPTLVMTGDHDCAPAAGTRNIPEAIQGSRLGVIEDCGHLACLEQPEPAHRATAELLES